MTHKWKISACTTKLSSYCIFSFIAAMSFFVDKEYRENAKASNCYTRKSGKFLPQYNSVMQPEFRKEYKDKISYFEMTDDFCTSDIMLRRYIDHILKNMMGKKIII